MGWRAWRRRRAWRATDLKITLLESRPRLGGRASSFTDPATGELVDNCQHVSMACCTNLADFCDRVGTSNLFRPEPRITFLSPEGRVSTLEAGPLPAPFHLSGSFLKANYLSVGERLRVAYGMACLRFARSGTTRRALRLVAATTRPDDAARSSATGPRCSSRP